MRISFILTKTDISDYLIFNHKRLKIGKVRNRIVTWSFSLAFLAAGITGFLKNGNFNGLLFSLGISLACFILFPLIFKLDTIIEVKLQAKSKYKSLINLPMTVKLEDSNIYIKTENEQKVIPISSIKDIIELEQKIYIELGGGIALIRPKTNLKDYRPFLKELKNIIGNETCQ